MSTKQPPAITDAATAGEPAASDGFPALLATFRRRFDGEMAAWIEDKRRAVVAEAAEAEELAAAVARLAGAGGKRLRPALVWFTWQGCRHDDGGSGDDGGAVLHLGLAAELLHTYLLIHDDIMDHSATRRGLPTAHTAFARRHGDLGLVGDGADFGVTAAILSGDLAHAWAHELAESAGAALPAARRGAVAAAFAATAQEVISGQYLEILLAGRRRGSAEELARALRLKSGRYSVERPIQLGALAAGADDATRAALSVYGGAVGEAFQLQDDVLGTFGDAGETGKPVASDLEEGKFTFLVYHALQALPPAGAAELRDALGTSPLDGERVARLRRSIEECGALERVRGMIAERLQTARTALADPDCALSGDGRTVLTGLVEYVARRRE
jgi:geranylgeranyl diphosphate synthase type I